MANNLLSEQQSFIDEIEGLKKSTIRRNSKRSISWFRNKIKNVDQQYKTRRPSLGQIYTYIYDAKHKDKLPYWDKLPLTVVLDYNMKYMLGLNFHYLAPKSRARFLKQLSEKFKAGMDEDARIMASYRALKAMNLNYYKPTIKLYLLERVESPFIKIPSDEWEMAVSLPMANFSGASANTVYADSRRMI